MFREITLSNHEGGEKETKKKIITLLALCVFCFKKRCHNCEYFITFLIVELVGGCNDKTRLVTSFQCMHSYLLQGHEVYMRWSWHLDLLNYVDNSKPQLHFPVYTP